MFILPDNGCRDPQWRRRISVAVMADTLFSIDPWTDDFAAAFRRALLKNAPEVFAATCALFPGLKQAAVVLWVHEACRDVPEERAFWRAIVRSAQPNLESRLPVLRLPQRHPNEVIQVMLGQSDKLARLPEKLAKRRAGFAFELAAADFVRSGGRSARTLIESVRGLRGVTGQEASAMWVRIRERLSSMNVRLERCEPETALLAANAQLFGLLMNPEAASILYETEDGACSARIGMLARASYPEKLLDLEATIRKGVYGHAEKMLAACFGCVPEGTLSSWLQAELRRTWFRRSPFDLNGIQFGENWEPMSEALARWLEGWTGLKAPGWMRGEPQALLKGFADRDFVHRFPLRCLERLANAIGLPAYEALAAWPYAQPLTVCRPEAYARLGAETVFRVLPSEDAYADIAKRRLDGALVVKLSPAMNRSQKAAWLKAWIDERPEPERTALKRTLAQHADGPYFNIVSEDDPVWLELGLERLLSVPFCRMLRAQSGAAARLEGASDAWLNAVREAAKPVRMPVKRKGKTRDQRNKDKRNRDKRNRDEPGRDEPKAVKIDCGSTNAQLLKTLLSRSSLRRRFVTDFLRPDMVTFEPDGGVRLLKRAWMNLKVLAEDMLRSKTFAGDPQLKAKIVCMAFRRLKKGGRERLDLLRLAVSRSEDFDVLRPEFAWTRRELEAVAGCVAPNHVEAFLKAVPGDGLELLETASPGLLRGRRFFELCCGRPLPAAGRPNVPLDEADLSCERACEILGIPDDEWLERRLAGCLERFGRQAGGALRLLADEARDVLSPSLGAMVDEALARLAVKPSERLKALEAAAEAGRGAVLDWWPQEGPDGVDGILYGLLRVHHRIEDVARLWPSDEACARRALRLMQRLWPRDAAWVEIMAVLGPQSAPLLRELIGRADFRRPLGCRFDASYARYAIPKKNGGERVIHAPAAALKAVQRLVNERILQPLGTHEAAWGFVPGRGITGNAAHHAGQAVVACADIRACFPSVGRGLVISVLRRDLGDAFSDAALMKLADIVLAEGVLPTGAPTSSAILNRVLLKTDEILSEAAHRRECVYTRYADDLAFSGSDAAVALLGVARGVLEAIGLELDPKKTNVFRRGRRQCCTGLVVNEKVNVRRGYARHLRAAVHALACGRTPQLDGSALSVPMLKGHIAFLESVKPEEGAGLRARLAEALAKEGGRHDD